MREHYWVFSGYEDLPFYGGSTVVTEDVGPHRHGLPDGYDLDADGIQCLVCGRSLVDLDPDWADRKRNRNRQLVYSYVEEQVGSPEHLEPCGRITPVQWRDLVKKELRELKVTPKTPIGALVSSKEGFKDDDEALITQLMSQGMDEEGALKQAWLIWWLEMVREYAHDSEDEAA